MPDSIVLTYSKKAPINLTVEPKKQQVLTVIERGIPGKNSLTVSNSAEVLSNCYIGTPLYLNQNGKLDLASASAVNTSRIAGLALTNAIANHAVDFTLIGTIFSSDWSEVIGSNTLSIGSVYYLNSNPGLLTTTPESTTGNCLVQVGLAITEYKLDLSISELILL